MITDNKQIVTQASLACQAQLTAEVMMRLSQNGVSGTNQGHFITRTSVASSALNTARTDLMKV